MAKGYGSETESLYHHRMPPVYGRSPFFMAMALLLAGSGAIIKPDLADDAGDFREDLLGGGEYGLASHWGGHSFVF